MPELVALDLPGGRGFVDALRAVWDTGDAACPLDPRLPPEAAARLIEALRPTRIVGPGGEIVALKGTPVEDGDALVVATSGSVGNPRGVVLTHAAVRASAEATSKRLGVDPTFHRWLACLPLAHIGGLSVVTRALLTDTPIEVMPRFEAEVVEQLGREGSVTHVSLVATMVHRIDPSVFSLILLGGSSPPDGLPENAVTTYGMTESGSGVVYDGVALEGVEIAIEMGEILLRGPTLLRAYRDGPAPSVPGPDGRGWFPTGDGGTLSSDGTLHVDGRLADVIVTGGENVWPAEVERILATHPDVAQVAVWKRVDPEWGERVVAWVVPAQPMHAPSLESLVEHVRETLSPWSAPKELVIVAELPTTPSGKVRRRDLT